METIVCPVCGHFDKIEKVSAIVAHQTQTRAEKDIRTETYTDFDGKSRTSTYTVPYEVVETTNLVKQLRLPPKPQLGTDRRGWLALIAIVLVASILIGVPFLLYVIWGIGDYRKEAFSVSLLLSIAPGLLAGFILLFIVFFLIKESASHKQDVLRVNEAIPHWEHAVERWNKAYYCYRDDIVFVPDDKNRYASLNKAIAYFYD